MIFTTLKAKLYAGAAIALGVLIGIVKVQAHRISKLKGHVKSAKKREEHVQEVAKHDIQVNQQTDSHRAELINEIDSTGDSTAFRDPNKLWDDTDD